ncbi:hypothetical protein [Spiroplasma culicicola]|uniref:Uncharacterized protein n=1 Tax=Spiroplasma culicicola AES-1 TaxID=1276246 RepID=W6AFW7_9MOLU|nr:hypothetical protein [Spiroplasma culicicola]AHI52604.1 hypothetical protein SCULI_v1c02630 [Spiroplasma culicicola AES-1]
MAKLRNGIVEFEKNDVEAGWNNAPSLVNKPENEYRMCYICKFHMIKDEFDNELMGQFGWVVDIINLKTMDFIANNFIAVHPQCIDFRPKADCTKIIKKVKSMQWKFDEDAFK